MKSTVSRPSFQFSLRQSDLNNRIAIIPSGWYWQWFFVRHKEFNSWFNVMTMNVIPFDRPKIVAGFTVIRWDG